VLSKMIQYGIVLGFTRWDSAPVVSDNWRLQTDN
jgi:hypothetical protein